MEFTVADAEGYTEDQVAVLGMGEADEDGHSVILQGNLSEVDESERQMGWDTYHLSIDEDDYTYGGISRCVMTEDAIRFDFNPAAAANLNETELILSLAVERPVLLNIAQYLRLILLSGRASEHPQLEIIGIE